MRDRITEKDLEGLCDVLNEVTGSPPKSYLRKDDGQLVGQIGNFHLNYAYGGVELHRMGNEHGGISCPLGNGHGTKRELWNKMHAFIDGIRLGRAEQVRP